MNLFHIHPTISHTIVVVTAAVLLQTIVALVYKHHKNASKDDINMLSAFFAAAEKPIKSLIWILMILVAILDIFDFFKFQSFAVLMREIIRLTVALHVAYFFIKFVSEYEIFYFHRKRKEKPVLDRTTFDGLVKLIRIIIIVITGFAILQIFGVPLTAVYTAAGGAGIGITLAAQDLLKNFFGGIVLYFDRPFGIGDWISSPDKSIEGTVTHIGWRSTIIRSFDSRPLYVPNSTFLTVSVQNPSRMKHRRLTYTFGVCYKDFDKVRHISQAIEDYLKKNKDIAHNQTIFVSMVGFGESTLDILVYCFTETTQWIPFQKIQEQVLIDTMEIVKSFDANFAFPTTTINIDDNQLNKVLSDVIQSRNPRHNQTG